MEAGRGYSIVEALAYLQGLLLDSGSMYFAEKANWKYPMSREALIAADLFDLHVQINSDPKKVNDFAYARPFDMEDKNKKIGGTAMPMERAKVLYKTVVQTKTDEEILEINRLKILANQQKAGASIG